MAREATATRRYKKKVRVQLETQILFVTHRLNHAQVHSRLNIESLENKSQFLYFHFFFHSLSFLSLLPPLFKLLKAAVSKLRFIFLLNFPRLLLCTHFYFFSLGFVCSSPERIPTSFCEGAKYPFFFQCFDLLLLSIL